MDGTSVSGGTGFVTAGLLLELRQAIGSGFLEPVDLFVGTSAGAFNALYFAIHDDTEEALDGLVDFWKGFVVASRGGFSPVRVLTALTGQSAFLSSESIREYLIKVFGRDTLLRDLRKPVVVPSFELDNADPEHRTWKPKVFHNTGDETEPDLDERVVDVALRSGSPPLIDPIFQGLDGEGGGFVDGGVYANNPAVVGLAQSLTMLSDGSGDPKAEVQTDHDGPAVDLAGILLLSLGNARAPAWVAPRFCDGTADWGYSRWLFDLRKPIELVTMFLESGLLAIDYECRRLLRGQYCRVNPVISDRLLVTEPKQVEPAIQKVVQSPSGGEQLGRANEWLQSSGWLGG